MNEIETVQTEGRVSQRKLRTVPPLRQRQNRYAQGNPAIADLLASARLKAGGVDDIDDLIDISESILDAFIGALLPDDFLTMETVQFVEARTKAIADLYEKKARIEASNQFVVTPQALRAFCDRIGQEVKNGTEAGYADCLRDVKRGAWPDQPEDGLRRVTAKMFEEIRVRVTALASELDSMNASGRSRRPPS